MYYWRIMHETRGLILAGLVPYATEQLARDASRRERMAHGWTMGDGYYDEVDDKGTTVTDESPGAGGAA